MVDYHTKKKMSPERNLYNILN